MGRRPLQHGVSFVPVSAHRYYSAGGGLLPVGRLWAGSFKPVLREEKGGGGRHVVVAILLRFCVWGGCEEK